MTECYIYAATAGQYVKIGSSTDVRSRVSSITRGRANMRPADLSHNAATRYLGHGPGGQEEEHRLHRLFSEHRVIGEWFTMHADVMRWARSLDRLFPPDPPLAEVRISDVVYTFADDLAGEHQVSRAVVLRAMLGVAAAHPREVAAKVAAIKDTA